MKKSLLICLLAVVLCVSMLFAACAPSLEAETLESMKELLYQMYKDSNPANTYEVVGMVASNGEKAQVKWTVNVTEGSTEYVKVGKLEDNKQTIEVEPYPQTDVKYTLTATLTNESGKAYTIDGEPVSISFERSLTKFVLNTYDQYLAACQANNGAGSGEQIRIRAYVIGVVCMSSSSAGSLYLQDADGHGYYAYKPTGTTEGCETDADLRAKWAIGTEVIVTGTVVTYNGQYEFEKDCTLIVTGNKATEAQLPYVDATAAFAAATSNEDTALAEYQNRRVTLKDAIITRIDETGTKGTADYKAYYYFTVGDSDVEFNVYYTIYFMDDATATTVCDKLVVGKKVDLTGIISVYSKDFQVYPDSANSVSNVRDVEYTDAEKIAAAKKNLTVVDTAVEGDVIELPATGALDTTIAWALDGEYTNVTLADGKLTVNEQIADTVVVKLVATISSGSTSENVTFEVTVPAARTSFIKAALNAGAAIADGETTTDNYMIIGTISEIDSEYSEQYKNVSFYVADAEGNKILVYRYNLEDAATVKVGDFVAFAAPIKNYKGTIEAVATFVSLDITTLADAAAAGLAGTGVAGTQVYGYVKSINTVYSEQYGNITVTISDGTNDFYIYRLNGGQDIMVGDYLLITGTPSQYNDSAQMAAGATYVNSPLYVAPVIDDDPVETDHAGTESDPYSVADAIKVATANGTSAPAEQQYVKGYIVGEPSFDASYNNYTVYIADEVNGTTTLKGYRVVLDTGIDAIADGDLVTIKGFLYCYNTTPQVQYSGSTNPTLVAKESGSTPPAHTCESVCPETGCGKCTDADCEETVCADKCEGHDAPAHTCESVCPETGCGKCTDADCEETACAEKCEGHDAPAHTCESVCPETGCGKCTDADCEETACAEKCEGHKPAVITSIADALVAADGVAVELTGTVTGYYNGYHSNFYIKDEDGKSILVYYSTANANLGDVVKVVGTLGSYNGTKQVAQGSTFTVITPHVCSDWDDATCTEAELCKVCDKAKTGSEALGHTDPNTEGKCDRCGIDLVPQDGAVTINLVTSFGTYAKDWSNSYSAHEINLSSISAVNGTLTLSRASKQTSTITDRPVIAANNSTVYATLVLSDNIASVTFDLQQWTTKTFTDIHIEYYDATTSKWVSCSSTITTPAEISSTKLPAGVTQVRLSITTTKTSNTQVGLTAIEVVYAPVAE